MNKRVVAAVLVAMSASFAAPVFASGYGPAPFYHPTAGAPASQRGQSAQTVAAEQNSAAGAQQETSYGGVAAGSSQSGGHEVLASLRGFFHRN